MKPESSTKNSRERGRPNSWGIALLGVVGTVAGFATSNALAGEDQDEQTQLSSTQDRGLLHDCGSEAPLSAEIEVAALNRDEGRTDTLAFNVRVRSHMEIAQKVVISQYTHDDRGNVVDKHKFSQLNGRVQPHDDVFGKGSTPVDLADGYYRTVVRALAEGGEESRRSISYEVQDGALILMDDDDWHEQSNSGQATEED